MSRLYEVIVMHDQKVGINSKEICESIYTCTDEWPCERFMAYLRTNGYTPRLRVYVCQPYINGSCNFEEILQDLRGREV